MPVTDCAVDIVAVIEMQNNKAMCKILRMMRKLWLVV
jgi:hypothetical protein